MRFIAKAIVVTASIVIIAEFVVLPMLAGVVLSVQEELSRREALNI
jgi:hypothetical protein